MELEEALDANDALAATIDSPSKITVEDVYGAGFEYQDQYDNPILGFRQPVVGDFFLDPDPSDGNGEPAPRKKITPTEYGPRLILSHR